MLKFKPLLRLRRRLLTSSKRQFGVHNQPFPREMSPSAPPIHANVQRGKTSKLVPTKAPVHRAITNRFPSESKDIKLSKPPCVPSESPPRLALSPLTSPINVSGNFLRPTLSPLERHLAYALAWLSGIDILEHAMFSDGVFNVLRSALLLGGLIFTDSQPFQQLLCANVFKHRVACISAILRLRSKTPFGPYNDVLSKLSSVLDPSSCVLALGTWQNSITNALSALRSNAISVSAVAICPLLPIPSDV